MMGEKICIAIAVHAPEQLSKLDGALNSASDVIKWAKAQGYKTCLITDGKKPVTISLLNKRIGSLISNRNTTIDRIIVAFAGHGAIAGIQDLWLLSKWQTQPNEAVDVQSFRSRLGTYAPAQVTIISDACRNTLPANAVQLQGSSVLPLPNWGHSPKYIDEDVFRATTLGYAAYMVSGNKNNKPYCLFTSIVTDALWGKFPEAIGQTGVGTLAVTSQTLKTAVRKHVLRAANALNQTQLADVVTNFTPPNDVYTVLAQTPVLAKAVLSQKPGKAFAQPRDLNREFSLSPDNKSSKSYRWNRDLLSSAPREKLDSRRSSDALRQNVESPGSSDSIVYFQSTPRRSDNSSVAGSSPSAFPRRFKAGFPTTPPTDAVPRRSTQGESETRLIVNGDVVSKIVVPSKAGASFDIGLATPDKTEWALPVHTGSILVQLGSGRWLGGPLYPDMTSSYRVGDTGAEKLMLHPTTSGLPLPFTFGATLNEAIAGLQTGEFCSVGASNLEAWFYNNRYMDPTISAVMAYHYNRIGDVLSIRTMAAFFASLGQPIPYDVALLGRLHMKPGSECLEALIPEIPERMAFDEADTNQPLQIPRIDASRGIVAGGFPWLSAGWRYLEDFGAPGANILAPLSEGLSASMFTTLDMKSGETLSGLVRNGDI